jgi:glutamate-ammonia-ligase adenylyltransferase
MNEIAPFIWRKHLDFAAIADIQSIKRQMNMKLGKNITLAEHNLKLGLGGIREIEFFVQTYQLIWGGRIPDLRTKNTCETLDLLMLEELIPTQTGVILKYAYRLFRLVEHRLQMRHDEQTHILPANKDRLQNIAHFSGFDSYDTFERELLDQLNKVHDIYVGSFTGAPSLSDEGNLVFTGVDHDPETLQTLESMGYQNPEFTSSLIQGWHRGSRRSTRNKRARELITELTPALLKAFANTINPDYAFLKFDDFLSRLPYGVQLFSLFNNNPELLHLIAHIMGSAPALSEKLTKNPILLDSVLNKGFFMPLPDRNTLEHDLCNSLYDCRGHEDSLIQLQQFKNEREFQAGIHLLQGLSDYRTISTLLSNVAEVTLQYIIHMITKDFSQTYGDIKQSTLAVIGLGKLGSHELTFHSDLDVVFIYDADDMELYSEGEKRFTASVYYTRLIQRIVNTLGSRTQEGVFYEIDTRLRPSSSQGPIATSIQALEQYFNSSAWTFEFMALCKARVMAGRERISDRLTQLITAILTQKRDAETIHSDVLAMQKKLHAEFETENIWDVKHIPGGIMDIDFLTEYLILTHANEHPEILHPQTSGSLYALAEKNIIGMALAEEIIAIHTFYLNLLGYLRLCYEGTPTTEKMTQGFKLLLTEQFKVKDFSALEQQLYFYQQRISQLFTEIVEN